MSRSDPTPSHDDFTRWLLRAQRESNARLLAKTAGVGKGRIYSSDTPSHDLEAKAFRAAPYHGWPL